ncbi:flagellar basal body P-ring formation chaperone FlgA [Roseomonas sp. OT10]|uniref:flagellar basal body P-ring formation chaperone FlgA n=1 Tax=Roseomonas cutis TaxID=2897332 RepID=UPI001E57839C|nr:flagellar basal body P-ring formation chaperone FlgA [Roseomonas sp. OT10]UFN48668.1 flagellar basal body P-ring formation chaperone FlgA [Roseomonas sp. OT10]
MIRLLALLALLLPAAARAQPGTDLASLRPQVVVEEETIRLGDLFDEAGPAAARGVGPAPAPGRRLLIETPQLLAIARAHGIAWRPLSANERVVVERPGRALTREEWHEPLRDALLALGMDPQAELELPGFSPPMVPPAGVPQVSVEQPSLGGNRFGATLVVLADGMPVLRMRVSGRASATVAVALATRRMAIGEVVRPGDVRVQRLRAERVRPGLAGDPSQVVGQQLRRPLGEGLPFALNDLGTPAVVERNSTVTMLMEAGGLALTAQGRALDSAPRGGVVNVMNLSSRQVVEAQAIGPGRVRVGPSPR